MAVNDVRYDADGRLIDTTDTADDSTVVDTAALDNTVVPGTNPDAQHDPSEGAALGGVGGAAVGAIAGAVTGPVGALIGGVIGAVAGGLVSAGAVAAVDRVDNDGSPGEAGTVVNDSAYDTDGRVVTAPADNYVTAVPVGTAVPPASTAPVYEDVNAPRSFATDTAVSTENAAANTVGSAEPAGSSAPGIQTGGRAMDGTPDTRGVIEKAEDKLTGDHIDDKTGKIV